MAFIKKYKNKIKLEWQDPQNLMEIGMLDQFLLFFRGYSHTLINCQIMHDVIS